MSHPTQLPLDIETHANQTFDNFCWHGNEILQSALTLTLKDNSERFFYIWGKSGVGKTHLTQAITQQAGANAIYLPMSQAKNYDHSLFDSMEQLDLICLDDIEQIAGQPELEEALFHLYNRIRENQHTCLIISGGYPLANLPIQLPDLSSRISWGLVFHLQELNEEDKVDVLEQQASAKGFSLTTSVAQYLITHCSRDMHQLTKLVDILDKASLAAKRKISIPFVKSTLGI